MKEHHDHWLPKLLNVAAITFGDDVFYALKEGHVPPRLRKHEEVHTRQYKRDGYVGFLYNYMKDYFELRGKWGLSDADAYDNIKYEREAKSAEKGY